MSLMLAARRCTCLETTLVSGLYLQWYSRLPALRRRRDEGLRRHCGRSNRRWACRSFVMLVLCVGVAEGPRLDGDLLFTEEALCSGLVSGWYMLSWCCLFCSYAETAVTTYNTENRTTLHCAGDINVFLHVHNSLTILLLI